MDTWSIRKKQSQTNPNKAKQTQNKPKSKKAKMNVTSILTVGYENISNWAICENKANSNPKQTQNKPKTNPIQSQTKPIQRQKIPFFWIPAHEMQGFGEFRIV